MNATPLAGLDGREPLGLFAALGLLSILSVPYPDTTLGWKDDEAGACVARIRIGHDPVDLEGIAAILAGVLNSLATADPDRITAGRDTIDFSPVEFRSLLVAAIERWKETGHDRPGAGYEHVTATIAPALLAAFAGEAIGDGEASSMERTPLSFSNGQSGKCLLKDFRAVAGMVTP
jgi:hypothetical protein